MGWTAGKFPSEECRMVQRVIYKMSCCHMSRHYHIWRKMAFSLDNSSSKNVNCRIAIWKFWLQNKLLVLFPVTLWCSTKGQTFFMYIEGITEMRATIPLHKHFFPYWTDLLMHLYMSVFFPTTLSLVTLFPTTRMFSPSFLAFT